MKPATYLYALANFSDDRTYRYTLWRQWAKFGGYVMFVGLNPSTADEHNDDPTVRRCIGYAREWGFRGLMMTNIFAYRATDPRNIGIAADPVGPDNDYWLKRCAAMASVIVAAWGAYGKYLSRGEQVRTLLRGDKLHYLKLTKDGEPSHPLYLPSILKPLPYSQHEKVLRTATRYNGQPSSHPLLMIT